MKVFKKPAGWQLDRNVSIALPVELPSFKHKCFSFDNTTSILTVKRGYFFDGASGPVRDTQKTMVPALPHDVFYHAMRDKLLPLKYKRAVDKLFVKMCVDRGRSKLLAKTYLKGLKWFGGRSCVPGSQPKSIEFN